MKTRLAILVAAIVVGAVGLGVGLGFGLSGNSGTGPGTTVGASQLASIRTGCQQWLRGAPTQPGTAQWCTDMTQWMGTYMGRSGFGPETMWGDPADLRAVCEHWLRTRPPSGAPTDPAGWCGSMVSWMATHVGSWSGRRTWGGWMQHGPMTGIRATASRPSTTAPLTTSPPATSPPATSPPTPTTSPPTTSPPAGGAGYGDTDHDGDCGPGYGDTDQDGDCGSGYGPGYMSPGFMMGGY